MVPKEGEGILLKEKRGIGMGDCIRTSRPFIYQVQSQFEDIAIFRHRNLPRKGICLKRNEFERPILNQPIPIHFFVMQFLFPRFLPFLQKLDGKIR